MAGLKYLEIHNFQSHKDTRLDFHPNTNSIIGESNAGKTAIFRALVKLWHNRPLGTRFMSHFAKKEPTIIILGFDDKEVTFEISKDGVVYRIFQDNKKIGEFKAVGSDVPDLISTALNLENINLQSQLESHFLIIATAPEVAREFNKITHIDKVDGWISNLTKKVNTTNKEKKVLESQVTSHEKLIEEYAYLPRMEADVIRLEQLQVQYDTIEKKITELTSLLQQLQDTRNEIAVHVRRSEGLELLIDKIERVYVRYKAVDERVVLLTTLIENREALRDEQDFINFIKPFLRRLDSIVPKYLKAVTTVNGLSDLLFQMDKKKELLQDWQRNLNQNKNTYIACLKLIGKCPVCFSPINGHKISEIIKNI